RRGRPSLARAHGDVRPDYTGDLAHKSSPEPAVRGTRESAGGRRMPLNSTAEDRAVARPNRVWARPARGAGCGRWRISSMTTCDSSRTTGFYLPNTCVRGAHDHDPAYNEGAGVA